MRARALRALLGPSCEESGDLRVAGFPRRGSWSLERWFLDGCSRCGLVHCTRIPSTVEIGPPSFIFGRVDT